MSPFVSLIGNGIAALGFIVAALIARQSIKNYRDQKKIDRESYIEQREIDRKNDLKKMRMEQYKQTIESVVDTIPDQVSADYLKMQLSLFVVASDEVLRRTGAVHEVLRKESSDPPTDPKKLQEIKASFTAMFRAMREDCFEATELSDEEISKLIPFM